MTDAALAQLLVAHKDAEASVRAYWETTRDRDERDMAVTTLRHVVAARKRLEAWIGQRACRKALA